MKKPHQKSKLYNSGAFLCIVGCISGVYGVLGSSGEITLAYAHGLEVLGLVLGAFGFVLALVPLIKDSARAWMQEEDQYDEEHASEAKAWCFLSRDEKSGECPSAPDG